MGLTEKLSRMCLRDHGFRKAINPSAKWGKAIAFFLYQQFIHVPGARPQPCGTEDPRPHLRKQSFPSDVTTFAFLTYRCSSSGNSRFDSCRRASNSSASGERVIVYADLRRSFDISSAGSEPLPMWFNTLILMVFLVVFRVLGYVVLRYIRRPR